MKKKRKSIFKRWWFWVIIGVMATLLALALGSGDVSNSNDTPNPDSSHTTSDPIKVSAAGLRSIYDENEVAAKKKYTNQLVAVTGAVDSIGTDITGTVYVTLDTGSTLKMVQCFFVADAEIDKVADISEGQEITVVGTCTGLTLTNVLVKDCSITDIKPMSDLDTDVPADSPTASPEKEDAVIEITASDLFAAFHENEVAANNQYKGKAIKITGTVANIGTDILDKVYITLETGEMFYSVQCYFANADEEATVATIAKGDTVTLVGTCDGMSLNVVLKRCEFQ